MKLYHFTCAHAAEYIRPSMVLSPHTQPQLDGRPLIWLTDLETPDRLDIGLTSEHISCDRMEYRAEADCDAVRWVDYVRRLPRDVRLRARDLTATHGLPMHWYVTAFPTAIDRLERVA